MDELADGKQYISARASAFVRVCQTVSRLTGSYFVGGGGSLSLVLISWLYSALAESTAVMAGIVGFTEKWQPCGL